jgi:hypothetical protein
VRRRIASIAPAILIAIAGSAWVLATEHSDAPHVIAVAPRPELKWPLSPQAAHALRRDALRRAQVRTATASAPVFDLDVVEPPLSCRFLAEIPTGTSPKFDCALENGEVVKVKYGRNPEVAAEVAATRLLAALGYPADTMSIAPRVRCDGCPRHPFFAMWLLQLTGLHARYPAHGSDNGYSDFEWVAIERKFGAPAIETIDGKGWAWWELKYVDSTLGATREDLDALRLLAVFLAHWDNKSENQRLVCLEQPSGVDRPCMRPIAMLQDLGATFGPSKLNLARWHHTPVWADRATCAVSMEGMPWGGGTFPEARISENGRATLARQLAAIGDEQARALFRAARFPEHYSTTDDERDLDVWTAAFRHRVEQITSAGPCPSSLIPKREYRIDPAGLVRGNQSGDGRHRRQQRDGRSGDPRIVGLDAVQLR